MNLLAILTDFTELTILEWAVIEQIHPLHWSHMYDYYLLRTQRSQSAHCSKSRAQRSASTMKITLTIHIQFLKIHMRLEGCPNPSKNGKMLGVHFFEPLYPCKDKMSIKKVFHFWPTEIAAKV